MKNVERLKVRGGEPSASLNKKNSKEPESGSRCWRFSGVFEERIADQKIKSV